MGTRGGSGGDRRQVRALIAAAAPKLFGADETNDGPWDPVTDLEPLVADILDTCAIGLKTPHRFLWFIGD